MKKQILSMVSILASVCMLSGCGKGSESVTSNTNTANDNKIDIICTAFPQYDWVNNIISGNEDKFLVTLLNDNGGDLHNYQPSAMDMAIISDCDLFIYVGGESDSWVEDALKEAVNEDMHIINMMDMVGDGLVLGEHHHDENEEHEHKHSEEAVYDEHVWLSLHNARLLVEGICDNIKEIDIENANQYERNCETYVKRLTELDNEYKTAADASETKTLLFADRFPFKYMIEDYGINYFAAFEGCSAETEASFETVAFLSKKTDELGLDIIVVIDGSDKKLAEVIIENTAEKNQQIVVLDSLQAVSKDDIESGVTYLKVMEDNLAVVEQALGTSD